MRVAPEVALTLEEQVELTKLARSKRTSVRLALTSIVCDLTMLSSATRCWSLTTIAVAVLVLHPAQEMQRWHKQ